MQAALYQHPSFIQLDHFNSLIVAFQWNRAGMTSLLILFDTRPAQSIDPDIQSIYILFTPRQLFPCLKLANFLLFLDAYQQGSTIYPFLNPSNSLEICKIDSECKQRNPKIHQLIYNNIDLSSCSSTHNSETSVHIIKAANDLIPHIHIEPYAPLFEGLIETAC